MDQDTQQTVSRRGGPVRRRLIAVAVLVLALLVGSPMVAQAGPNDLLGDEGPGCAGSNERHSGTVEYTHFPTQVITVTYNWCEGPGNVITWWQRPTVTIRTSGPGGGVLEGVEVDDAPNTAVERPGPQTAIYNFTVIQSILPIAEPLDFQQRYSMSVTLNSVVDTTTLCLQNPFGEDRSIDCEVSQG